MDCKSCIYDNQDQCRKGHTANFSCKHWWPKSGTVTMSQLAPSLPVIDVSDADPLASSTSKGNQTKWYLPNSKLFVKAAFKYGGPVFRDYLCERAAYLLGVQLGLPVLSSTICGIKYHDIVEFGSYTQNFLGDNDVHVTMYRLLLRNELTSLVSKFERNAAATERVEATLEVLQDYCGLAGSEYLRDMTFLDCLIGNEDRHLNNFGVIYNPTTNSFRFPPLFDNGLSMFEHDTTYIGKPLDICIRNMKGRPFSTNLLKSYKAVLEVTKLSPVSGCICLEGVVFPSENARKYVRVMAEKLGIQVEGRGVIINERC